MGSAFTDKLKVTKRKPFIENIIKYFNIGCKGPFFRKLIISYLIIVFSCTITMSIFFYSFAFSNIKSQVINSNQRILINYRNTIDSYILGNIENLSFSIINSISKDEDLLYFCMNNFKNDHVEILKIYKYLDSIKAITPYIDTITIYYESNNLFVSTDGMRSGNSQNKYKLRDMDIINKVQNKSFIKMWVYAQDVPEHSLYNNQKSIDLVSYIRKSCPISLDSACYVSISISASKLFDSINSSVPIPYNNLFILDDKGQILKPAGEHIIVNDIIESEIFQKITDSKETNGFFEYRNNEENYIVSYIASNSSNWRIFVINPVAQLMNNYSCIFYIVITIALTILAAGILLSILFAFRTYTPLARLTSKCRNLFLPDKVSLNNEYDLVTTTLQKLSETVNSQADKIREVFPLLKHHLILSFMKPDLDKDEIESKLAFLDIAFPYPVFQALVINCKNPLINIDIQSFEYIKLAAMDKINEFFEYNRIFIISTFLDDTFICIINMKNSTDTDISLFENLLAHLKSDFNLPFYCSPSPAVCDRMQLPYSFKMANESIEYKYIYPKKYLLFPGDVLPPEEDSYQYKKIESDLVDFEKAISTNQLEEAITLIHNICKGVCTFGLTMEQIKSILRIVVFHMKILYNYYSATSSKLRNTNMDLDSDYEKIADIEEFEKWACSIVEIVLSVIQGKYSPHNNIMVEYVKQYVSSNIISNQEISLYEIAGSLHISHSHLSRVFKEETGYNFVDYIMDVRMENAKKLLTSTNKKVDEIADMVGYTTTPYFIKKFREKYGISPKKFRTMYNAENNL
ncbi:MAG: AraC family transcriptional regulator [Clostridiaceae bacterium]